MGEGTGGGCVETGWVSETRKCDQVQLVRPEVKECRRFCEQQRDELTPSLANFRLLMIDNAGGAHTLHNMT